MRLIVFGKFPFVGAGRGYASIGAHGIHAEGIIPVFVTDRNVRIGALNERSSSLRQRRFDLPRIIRPIRTCFRADPHQGRLL
jgi:hypothetical protein